MNVIRLSLAALTVVVAFAVPAFAQHLAADGARFNGLPNQTAWDRLLSSHPKAAAELSANPNLIYQPEWRTRHPAFGTFVRRHPADWRTIKADGSQYYDAKFNSFLGGHPNLAAQLQANPNLINDPAFRRSHPALNAYLASHPNVWNSLRRQNMASSSLSAAAPNVGVTGQGAYDQTGTWRDANWWHENNVGWARQHHPEWWQAQGPYYGRPDDGDWDEDHHEWHDRGWWHEHHPEWVHRHHPDWWHAHKEAIAENHRRHEEWTRHESEERHHGEWHSDHGHRR